MTAANDRELSFLGGEGFWRKIVEESHEGVLALDAERRVVYANRAMASLLGLDVEELLGRFGFEFIHSEDLPEHEERFTLRRQGVGGDYEQRLLRKDGSALWCHVSCTPRMDERGVFQGVVGFFTDISAKKAAEEKLRESEEKYRLLFEAETDAVFIIDIATLRILEANPAACQLYGYDREAFLAKTPLELSAEPEETRNSIQRKGEVFYVPLRLHKRSDGTTFPVEIHARNLMFQGSLCHLAAIRNISDRFSYREELRKKTEELERFFTLSLDLLCIADIEGHLLRLNPAWEATLGYKLAELEGKKFLDFVHPDDIKATLAIMAEQGEGKQVLNFSNRYRCKDGSYRWIEWRSSSPVDSRLIYAAARDVTGQKAIEHALRSSEESLRNLIESSPMGIHMYRLDEEGRLLFTGFNRAADKILGLQNRQFLGMTIEEAFPPLAATEIPERYRRACLLGEPWQTEQVQYQDGKIHGAYLVYAFQTSPGSMAVLFLDVTERKRAEEIREKLEEQLLQSQKMEAVGRLAGGVAHDFNNLLTAILGYCDLASFNLPPDGALAKDLDEIRNAAVRAAALTHQLLAFSRKQVLQPRVLNLAEVVSDIQKMVSRILGEDIRLDVKLDGDTGYLLADPGQINQVIMNLVVNARDAMPQGGVLTLETSNFESDASFAALHHGMSPGPFVVLSVSDNGEGMDEHTREHIFEPFFTTKGLGKGTGLGLATVHGIVNQSGGHIWLYSEPGEGTTFKIFFPRVYPETVVSPRLVEEAALPRGSGTVLVVEDATDVRALACRALAMQGYRVYEAASGVEALEISRRLDTPIDLLLTDVVMPGMNGGALAKQLLEERPGLKVLFMSGYTDNAIVHQGVLERGVRYIQKPFRTRELAELVGQMLEQA